MHAKSRLLVVEQVLAPPGTPDSSKIVDIVMLALPGGRERTAAEYGDLFGRSGLSLQRSVPTESQVTVLEAVRTS
jgi:hypothetical protein